MLPSRLLAEDKGMLTQLVPGSQVSHGLAAGWRLNVSLLWSSSLHSCLYGHLIRGSHSHHCCLKLR